MADIIPYYRVSTKKQGDRLGMAGQQSAVEAYAKMTGSRIIGSYKEIESGRDDHRPELAKCLAHARRSKAQVVIAKMDRLSRRVSFLSALLESGVEFVAADNPNCSRLSAHILASVAENEQKMISDRTKRALAEAKKRGTLLGSSRPGHWDGREQARLDGLAKGRAVAAGVVSRQAREAYADIRPVMVEMRANGLSLRAIAAELNAQGHTTRRGKTWNPMQVSNVLEQV
jgi:DNA invertase Pin-like site-specific DNA recombinase